MKKYFGRNEIVVLVVTLVGILVITLVNFQISYRKARDAQRKTDIGDLRVALEKFKSDYGVFPPSVDGKIAACVGDKTIIRRKIKVFANPIPCQWGVDSFSEDPTDVSYPKLFKILPADPVTSKGRLYVYYSNGNHYQLYAAFEGKSELEYDKNIDKQGFKCGNEICNAGKSDEGTDLTKPLAQ